MSKMYKCDGCVQYCEMKLEREPVYCMLDGEKAKWEEVKEEETVEPKKTKLPDWVEVGGYVYDKRNGYGKIVSGSVKSCYIEFHGGAGDFVPEAFSKLQQARLRPYNEKEMKHMVGQVVLSKNGDVALVTDYDSSDQEVLIAGAWYNAKRLLASAWLHVNNPCGVLEHLEDGEWVE